MLVPQYKRSSSLRILSQALENAGPLCFLCYIWKWKTFPEISFVGFRDKGCSLFCTSKVNDQNSLADLHLATFFPMNP